mgnify:CR=1 FL=1
MTIAQQVFLYAAEEKSITKPQKKHLSHSNVPAVTSKIWKAVRHASFHTKPVFALIPAGEYLLSSLYRLNILEREIDDGMKEIGSGMSGILRLGINPTRARILIPSILLQCKALIPGLQLSVCFGDRDFSHETAEPGCDRHAHCSRTSFTGWKTVLLNTSGSRSDAFHHHQKPNCQIQSHTFQKMLRTNRSV